MRLSRLLPPLLCLAALPAFAVQAFSFVHVSDLHYPHASGESARTLAMLPHTPTAVAGLDGSLPAPSFILATGDLNEFGGGRGNWEGMLEMLRRPGLPFHLVPGNHDNTWDCSRECVRRLEGEVFYAFQFGGAKFIGFDTATAQDPRPSVATEGLRWLTAELQRTPPEQPVLFFCHHPLVGTEWASPEDPARLLAALRTRNVVLVLVGHGHNATHQVVGGLDCVMGGSTFGANRGYSLVSLTGGRVSVVHQYVGAQPRSKVLLDKPLFRGSQAVRILSIAPAEGTSVSKQPLEIRVRTQPGAFAPRHVHWTCEGRSGDLAPEQGLFSGHLDGELLPGARVLRLEFHGDCGHTIQPHWLWVEGGPLQRLWWQALPGQCQGTPLRAGERLYVGCNDGRFYCLNATDGNLIWSREIGGELRGAPLMLSDGRVCVASSRGTISCFTPAGVLAWRTDTGAPLYASLARGQGRVLCASTSGALTALSPDNGRVLWRSNSPRYALESGFAVAGPRAWIGAWDRFVHALSLTDGHPLWRSLSKGSAGASAPDYYSPADCPPVVIADRLYVCDRGYWLTTYNALTGEMLSAEAKCSAVARGAEDTLYVRHSDGRLSKRGADGATQWEIKVATGYLPVPPVEAGERLWTTSDRGLLTVLQARSGEPLAQVQVAPGQYLFAAPAVQGDEACVADASGNVTALRLPR